MQRKYAKNYSYQDVTDEDGKASVRLVYTGTYYASDLPEETLGRFRRESLYFSGSACLLFLGGGCLPSLAGRSALTLIPWLILLLCLLYFLRGSLRLRTAFGDLTEDRYEASYARTARSVLLAVFFSALTLGADLILFFTRREEMLPLGDGCFFASVLLCGLVCLWYFRKNREVLNSVRAVL